MSFVVCRADGAISSSDTRTPATFVISLSTVAKSALDVRLSSFSGLGEWVECRSATN